MSSTHPLPPDFTLETPRCRLRPVHRDDIPHVFSASRFPGFTDGMLWEPPGTIEELEGPHENSLRMWREGSAYTFSLEEKETGEFLGRIVIAPTETEGVWRIGFWTHPNRQGQGFMTEAATVILVLGFEGFGAEAIEACHACWNKASEKVLTKIGMRFVRHIPEGILKRGEWSAENLVRVTREEWAEERHQTAR